MALDREKTFENAERLLKQGRVPQALEEFKRLADESPRDLLTLNRIGDSLARCGRNGDAIAYYDKVADQFTNSGFYPRAVAILKKVIKLEPNRADALIRLGDLSIRQKHPGEARQYLRQAAEILTRLGQASRARDVLEKLVAVDPSDPAHRVRFAEAVAAEGDRTRAGTELLAASSALVSAGRFGEATKALQRVLEWTPDRVDAVVALAGCLASQGLEDEALRTMEDAVARRPDDPALLGEQLVLYEELGRRDRSTLFLLAPAADLIPDEAIDRALTLARSKGAGDALWERVVSLTERRAETGRVDRACELLDRLVRLDPRGFLPALECLCDLRRKDGARPPLARAIERLILARRAHGETETDPGLEAELRAVDPASYLLPTPQTTAAPTSASSHLHDGSLPAADAHDEIPLAYRAPAVPLTPPDQEFVNGHLTEADVFQKYGLINEALQQLREVARRFPGHVSALERLAALLRGRPQKSELRDTLVALGVARRASGDIDGARRDVTEASHLVPIAPDVWEILGRLGLVEGGVPKRAPTPAASPAASAPSSAPEAGEFEISFDDGALEAVSGSTETASETDERAAPPSIAEAGDSFRLDDSASFPSPVPSLPAEPEHRGGTQAKARRVPTQDMLDEIAQSIADGQHDEAARKIEALRTLGFGSPDLDDLEARASSPVLASSPRESRLDDEELSSITEALEAEFGATDEDASGPVAEPDIRDALDEFKRRVEDEVGRDDYRTHYDLGIAYKEMGLTDDALDEFQIAARSPELFREACAMIALCHRERGNPAEAVRWYREALAAPGAEDAPLSGVRYDLAEVLVEGGDYQAALDLFLQVMHADPAYRDVRRHVSDLRLRLGG